MILFSFCSASSHLFRTAGSSAGTSRRSSCSDEIFDDIDGNFLELNDKVILLFVVEVLYGIWGLIYI